MPATPRLSSPRRRLLRSARALAAQAPALALLAALAACGGASTDTQFAPACPALALVPGAADLSRFDGHGLDVTNLVTRVRITGVPAKCEPGKSGTVRATLHLDADITRGPASGANPPPVPYFIALLRGDTVVREQDFALTASFPSNVDETALHGEDIELLLPVGANNSAAGYRIYVGFRLTPEELAYNRAHPRR